MKIILLSIILSIPPLFQIQPPIKEAGEVFLQPLMRCLEYEGWEVEFINFPDSQKDVFLLGDRINQIVHVNNMLGANSIAGSLIYQLAYIHRPPYLSQKDQDALSEGVSTIILQRLNLPTADSIAYLERFPDKDKLFEAEKEYMTTLSNAIYGCVIGDQKAI